MNMSIRCVAVGMGSISLTPSEVADLESAGKSFLLDNIKEERARELGFELLRKDDLVRWGDFGGADALCETVGRRHSGQLYLLLLRQCQALLQQCHRSGPRSGPSRPTNWVSIADWCRIPDGRILIRYEDEKDK